MTHNINNSTLNSISNETFNWETGAWNILKLMMKEPNFLIQHQINPFNEFLDKGLKNVIEQFNPITLNYDFVGKQQFYKFKEGSKYITKPDGTNIINNWNEFIELSDIYKVFKEKYSIINNQVTKIDLSEHLGGNTEKEKLIQTEFKEFIETEIEFKNIEVNKHRYDLEIEIFFHSITPPTIFENNGSQKQMYPNEARLRNFTYASNIYANVCFRVRERYGEGLNDLKETTSKTIPKVNFGKLPIMLGSKACILSTKTFNKRMDYEECEFDEGGYFIVNGTEKVIIGQERQAENKIYVFKNSKSQSKYSYICEVKSLPDKKIVTPKNIQVKITSKESLHGKNIKVSIPHIKQDVPLFVVFKALGVINDYDITNYILYNVAKEGWGEYTQFLRSSLEEASTINTQQLAKEYLCKYVNMMGYDRDKSERDKRMTYLNDIIKNDFLPHVGESYVSKAYYLGHMVKRLLDVFLKKKECDDRDSYVNKRIDTAGILMANLFRQYYTKLIKDMKTNINKEYTSGAWKANKSFENIINQTNIYKIIKYSTITTGIKFALATGNWGLKNNKNKQGIAQVLSRLTYNSTLSHLRRINTPMEKSSKLVAPRKLHGTQMMYICGAETPEGHSVGVVKNLALSCHITNYSDVNSVTDIVEGLDVKKITDIDPTELFGHCQILINGNWSFVTNKPKKVYDILISLRRQGIINIHTSIVWKIDDNSIEIYTDAGRCTRPLYIIKNNNFVITNEDIKKIDNGLLKWNNLIVGSLNEKSTNSQKELGEGFIEFIDVQEENNCMIAITQAKLNENGTKTITYQYTHAEIHPSFLQGVLASIIPFSDHNQSPRNTYQSAMGKQAMGIYATNFRYRMDTVAHILRYPQLPLVNSRVIKYLPSNDLPSGINVIVAIASFSGYNQEDSIIMNKSATQRGLFISDHYHTYKDEEKKRQSSSVKMQEKFTRPNPKNTLGTRGNNYTKINDNGLPEENTYLKENDVAIGKTYPIHSKKDDKELYRCCSTTVKAGDEGFVDKVIVSRNGDGYKFVKVRIRVSRIPTIGDKHASRHGQKGTVGMIYRQDDMPFTKSGITPDLIMNPHAVPSRMTIAQVIECLMGKAGLNLGMYGDATAFTKVDVNKLGDLLESLGFQRHCDEILYNGRTGEQLKVPIFIGPTYYQRLKHMVVDKAHCLEMDHEVLTKKGWKFFPEITMDDEIATLEQETHNLIYSKPLALHYYPEFSGEIYTIKNSSIDLSVTSEHRMFVSKRYGKENKWLPHTLIESNKIYGKNVKYLKNANNINEYYQFILPETYVNNGHSDVLLNEIIVNMDEWLTFLGIWYAEGWTSTDNKKVSISVNKQRVKDALFPALTNLGFHYYYDSNAEKAHIVNRQLYNYMSPLSVGAPNKVLPEWVFNLNKSQTQNLLISMALGDGCFEHTQSNGYVPIYYYTSSNILADQYMQLCLHAGWSGTKHLHFEKETNQSIINGREVINKHDIWKISIIMTKNTPSVNHGHTKNQNAQVELIENKTTPVFCLTVPTEVFMVRRNGKMVWTGNSRAFGPNVILTRQPVEGRSRDGGLRFGEMERDAILSHGAAQFLKETLQDRSDNYRMFTCQHCGLVCSVNREANIYNCKNCSNTTSFAEIRLPYAMKLFMQELETMGVAPRLLTKEY